MDDSPRSSKRRKLDTPKRMVSSPLAKPSAKKATGKLSATSASYANGTATPDVNGKPASKKAWLSPSAAKNATLAKRAAVPAIDIYDDIEGALRAEVSPRPTQRRLQTLSREGTASIGDITDELQENLTTPSRGKGASTKLKPTSTPGERRKAGRPRKTSTAGASGRKRKGQETLTRAESEQVNGTTPSKPRSAKRINSSARKQVLSEEEDEEDTIAVTPSKTAKRRRKAVESDAEISETEDDISSRKFSKKPKGTASARRRMNRTDHFNNQEERWLDVENDINDEEPDDEVDGNSVVGSVLDPTEPSPFNKPVSARKEKFAPPLLYGNLSAGRGLDLLKSILMERIAGKRPSPLVGLDEEYKSVYQLIEQTITAGEGNSMLVIGARGSGKTTLVNKVLSEVSKNNSGEYHVVRLNGFIHTDDKIALREIWRQLGKEMEIEEDGSGPGKNYADTLTTLLALLSHPSEHTGEHTDQVAKAVIFIMDEFDLFAQHPRQTLLYNLFDIAQSRKAPIAVLGLTTRIDVTDSLEKRVKSRFSHRYVHLSLAKTFTAFQEVCKACLTVQFEQLSIEERGILEDGTKGTPSKKSKTDKDRNVLAEWNANIEKLFGTPSFITAYLAPPFYRTKSIPTVLTSFLLPTATLCPNTTFAPTNLLTAPDSKLSIIPHLSTLALSLLIAAARLDIIHDSDTCNFNMAYDEYVTLASKARIQSAAGGLSAASSTSKVWGKDVARREWEGLVELGFIMPIVAGQAGGFGMVKCDVALEEIGEVIKGEKSVDKGVERWCKSI